MDIFSLVLGTTGLISVVEKSFDLVRILQEAQSFPQDVAGLVFQMNNESQKIYAWSLEAVAHQHALRTDERVERPEPNRLQAILQERIALYTAEMEKALSEAWTLTAHNLFEDDPELADTSIAGGLVEILKSLRVQPDPHLMKAQLQRRQLESYLKSRVGKRKTFLAISKPWGQPVKGEFKSILERLRYWNSELESVLLHQQISALRSEVSARIMADCNENLASLEIIAVDENGDDDDTTKSAHLALQVMGSEALAPTSTTPYSIAYTRVAFTDNQRGTLTTNGGATQTKVFIDWLDYTGLSSEQAELASSRITALCSLLDTPSPKSLPTLKPLGYINDRTLERFGILSEIPTNTQDIVSLRLIMGPGDRASKPAESYPRLTLGQRFRLARKLCGAFLELHKSKWLHRGFSSSCVAFTTDKHRDKTGRNVEFLAINGFQHARPSGRQQTSLPIFPGGAGEDLTLYHHPDIRKNLALSPEHSYVKYLARHDIYSLGVVLLEIGVWKPIAQLGMQVDFSPDEAARRLRSLAKKNLPHSMGQAYADVVCRCLDGFEALEGMSETSHEIHWMLYEILKPMEDCQCRI